jgi:hypothetical protein
MNAKIREMVLSYLQDKESLSPRARVKRWGTIMRQWQYDEAEKAADALYREILTSFGRPYVAPTRRIAIRGVVKPRRIFFSALDQGLISVYHDVAFAVGADGHTARAWASTWRKTRGAQAPVVQAPAAPADEFNEADLDLILGAAS